MTLNFFESIGEWFVNLFTKIGNFFKPMQEWFAEVTEPVKNFVIENTRNPFLWVGIIVVGLIVFELVYKTMKKRG